MRAALARGKDMLTPLAADLAFSRLTLAALRAVDDEPPTGEERLCAAKLRESLQKQISSLRDINLIPAEVVPHDGMRRELQETLGTLTYIGTIYGRDDLGLLERLVSLLERFERQSLSITEAKDLLAALLKIGGRDENRLPLPDLNSLFRAVDAR